jgi:hypothetical protein
MAFKIIEGLFAIFALVQGFACGGAEFAQQFRMRGSAPRAGYRVIAFKKPFARRML